MAVDLALKKIGSGSKPMNNLSGAAHKVPISPPLRDMILVPPQSSDPPMVGNLADAEALQGHLGLALWSMIRQKRYNSSRHTLLGTLDDRFQAVRNLTGMSTEVWLPRFDL